MVIGFSLQNRPTTYKPLWVGKQGQKELVDSINQLFPVAESILYEYEVLAGTPYTYENLEDIGITKRHLESIIYWNTHIGVGESSKGNKYVMGAKPVMEDMYGEPYEWTPLTTNVSKLPDNIIKKYKTEEHQCIKLSEYSTAQIITDKCIWQASAYLSTNQNVISMRMPVVVTGVDSTVEMDFIDDAVVHGFELPYLGSKGVGVEALDLKPQNFLDPLTGYIDFLHNKTLAKLGIDALGTQKASGITTEEAVLILAEIKGVRDNGLDIRNRICDMINDEYGTEITVRENDIYLDSILGNPETEDSVLHDFNVDSVDTKLDDE